jgi:SAM-dependent methyltransferase
MSTGRSAEYVLGGSDAERARLRAQAGEFEASAKWLLETIGLQPGARVLDVGCGPFGILALLADAVGSAGEVVGLEREHKFVEMARAEVARLGLGTSPSSKAMLCQAAWTADRSTWYRNASCWSMSPSAANCWHRWCHWLRRTAASRSKTSQRRVGRVSWMASNPGLRVLRN